MATLSVRKDRLTQLPQDFHFAPEQAWVDDALSAGHVKVDPAVAPSISASLVRDAQHVRGKVHIRLRLSGHCAFCDEPLSIDLDFERPGRWMDAAEIDDESPDFAEVWAFEEHSVTLDDFFREEVLLALPVQLSCNFSEDGVRLVPAEAGCASPDEELPPEGRVVASAAPADGAWSALAAALGPLGSLGAAGEGQAVPSRDAPGTDEASAEDDEGGDDGREDDGREDDGREASGKVLN